MATVAVIGVATAAVVLTAAPATPQVTGTAERLAARLSEARTEAILSNRTVSATLDARGYRFSVLDGREWAPAQRPLGPVVWEAGVTSPGVGQTWTFDPTGAVEPAERVLSAGGRSVVVRIDDAGRIVVVSAGGG